MGLFDGAKRERGPDIQKEKMGRVKMKLKEYANTINELTDELEKVRKERDNYLQQLLETRDKLIRQDYTVQNQKKRLEDTGKTLVLYEKENKALRALVEIWI